MTNPLRAAAELGIRSQKAPDETRKFARSQVQMANALRETSALTFISGLHTVLLESNTASRSVWEARQSHSSQFVRIHSKASFKALFDFCSPCPFMQRKNYLHLIEFCTYTAGL